MTDPDRSSRIPKLLGLVALAVLAIAFAGALFGSLRASRWQDAQRKADLVEPELAVIPATFERAEELLRRHERAAGALEPPPRPSEELDEVRGLLETVRSLPRPERPGRSTKRVPSGRELESIEDWLDLAYRRLAAAKDLDARLPGVTAEVERLEAEAALDGERELR